MSEEIHWRKSLWPWIKQTQTMIHYRTNWSNRLNQKDCCSSKDSIKKIKTQTTNWEKYFQITCLIKDLYPKYMKSSFNSIR